MAALPDSKNLSSRDVVMPVVPMFHANGWSLAFSTPMVGRDPGACPAPSSTAPRSTNCSTKYKVTFTAAVPTVWLMLLQHLEKTGGKLPYLKRVVIGGSACPRAMTKTFQDVYGVEVIHAWGMTEMSPLGIALHHEAGIRGAHRRRAARRAEKQGHAALRRRDEDHRRCRQRLPWDGKTFGRLKVRGPAVAQGLLQGRARSVFDADGCFDTGDVATMDRYGYMQITDRSKDVIKSGGEWISSIDLENLAVGHPQGGGGRRDRRAHPKWDERPLLVVVLKKGETATKDDILGFMQGKIAKWWMPDDVVFVPEIPHTATGKIQKITLRQQFTGYRAAEGAGGGVNPGTHDLGYK